MKQSRTEEKLKGDRLTDERRKEGREDQTKDIWDAGRRMKRHEGKKEKWKRRKHRSNDRREEGRRKGVMRWEGN